MGDLHQMIIHDIGQVVGRHAVGLEQDLCIHQRPVQLHGAAQHILDFTAAVRGHTHANHVRRTVCFPLCLLVGGQFQIHRLQRPVLALLFQFGTQDVQLLTGAVAFKGVTFLNQRLGILSVHMLAFALPIRAMGAAHVRAFVPAQPQPLERIQNHLLGLVRGAGLIRVFNSQNELTTVLVGKTAIEQGNIGGAYVRVTGGRRRYAGADGHADSNSANWRGLYLSQREAYRHGAAAFC